MTASRTRTVSGGATTDDFARELLGEFRTSDDPPGSRLVWVRDRGESRRGEETDIILDFPPSCVLSMVSSLTLSTSV